MDYNILECFDCKETYLADNYSDGYNCPKCDGHIRPIGNIEEMKRQIKRMKKEIEAAKKNGLIRNYFIPHNSPRGKTVSAPSPKLPPPKPKGPPSQFIGGLDLASGKDQTMVININSSCIDEDKLAEEIIKKINNHRRSGTIV